MILRDPVHGLISFDSDEESLVPTLLEAAEVQRLRRIRQLGLTSLSYPGADHNRFSHAIGTAHVMKRFIQRMRGIHDVLPFWQRLTTERARDALGAALLHDVGHGPLSHLFEEAVPGGPTHEEWTARIILDPETEVHQILVRYDSTLPHRVAELVHGRHPLAYLARAVSGTFDVDRCDYLLRDAHFTGVGYGHFDLGWLHRSFCFGRAESALEAPPLAIDGAKGLPAIESFILARLFMFQQVYFHKSSRASELMLGNILRRACRLIHDGGHLPAMPAALRRIARDGDAPLGEYLELDDTVLWSSISAWRQANDEILRDLCCRLYSRKLFKTHELDATAAVGDGELLECSRRIARQHGLDPDYYVGLDEACDTPFDDSQDPLTVVYRRGVSRKPGDVSFLLGRLRGEKMRRVRLVFAPELREPIVETLEG